MTVLTHDLMAVLILHEMTKIEMGFNPFEGKKENTLGWFAAEEATEWVKAGKSQQEVQRFFDEKYFTGDPKQ